jgi:3-phenylpropionate/cinnamic acid dioxygenase small subunit
MTDVLSTRTAASPASAEASFGPFLADSRVQRAIELVWQEAALLDAKDYEAWLGLYTDDAYYVIPIDPRTEDFEDTLNMVYDDARMRRMRVTRLVEGYSISAVDSARTVRTVSRFTVTSVSDTEVTLRSAQVLVSFKRGTHAVLGADLEHHITLTTTGGRISRKVVRLVNSDAAVNASGYLL